MKIKNSAETIALAILRKAFTSPADSFLESESIGLRQNTESMDNAARTVKPTKCPSAITYRTSSIDSVRNIVEEIKQLAEDFK